MKPKIAVVGSLNIDHNYLVNNIPIAGETIASQGVVQHFGGKGANQATAAARAGGEVFMIGCIGSDTAGSDYLNSLAKDEIDTSQIIRNPDHPTGSAIILSEKSGENLIIVEAGANGQLTPTDVENAFNQIETVDIILLQLECPMESVVKAASIGRETGAKVIVNPSPWDDAILRSGIKCDVLIVNETEAAQLGDSAFDLCDHLIITQGAAPTIYRTRDSAPVEISTISVEVVDTVGAGDTFAGAFSVALGEGRSFPEAIAFANKAGALATTSLGAQSAIPSRSEIDSR